MIVLLWFLGLEDEFIKEKNLFLNLFFFGGKLILIVIKFEGKSFIFLLIFFFIYCEFKYL